MEAMLSPNSGFTDAERTRLMVAQTTLFGARGLPGMDSFMEYLDQKYPEGEAPGVFGTMVREGFYNTFFKHTTGNDLGFAERMSPLTMIPDYVSDVVSGRKTALELLGGPTLSIMGSVVKTGVDATRYGSVKLDEGLLRTATRDISSMSTGLRAYYAYNFGKLLARDGYTEIDSDISKKESLIYGLFGINSREVEEYYLNKNKTYSFYQDADSQAKSLATVLRNTWDDIQKAQDPKEIEHAVNSYKLYIDTIAENEGANFATEVDAKAHEFMLKGMNADQQANFNATYIDLFK